MAESSTPTRPCNVCAQLEQRISVEELIQTFQLIDEDDSYLRINMPRMTLVEAGIPLPGMVSVPTLTQSAESNPVGLNVPAPAASIEEELPMGFSEFRKHLRLVCRALGISIALAMPIVIYILFFIKS